jgi:hypothetical protein
MLPLPSADNVKSFDVRTLENEWVLEIAAALQQRFPV